MRERDLHTLTPHRTTPAGRESMAPTTERMVMAWTDRFICTRWSMVRVLLAFVYGFVLHSK